MLLIERPYTFRNRPERRQPISPETDYALPAEDLHRIHHGDLVPDLPASENKRFYPALDGLRALAVLMVFSQHYIQHPLSIKWGWTGVDIFFVLSGFLITGILYDTRETKHRFRNFYVRRTLRIFPLYYGVLLIGLLLSPIFHWRWHPAWTLWPLYLGNYARFLWFSDYLHYPMVLEQLVSRYSSPGSPVIMQLGHFWSLCIEEQFYLAWPLVVFWVKDRVRLRNICAAAFALCLLGRIACALLLPTSILNELFLERFTPLRVDALLLGGFIALTLRGEEATRIARLAMPVIVSVTALFIVMQGAMWTKTHEFYQPGYKLMWLQTIGYSLIDLFAAAVILQTIDPTTRIFALLSRTWLRRLGQMSYGFYVFHDIPHVAYTWIAVRLLHTHQHLSLMTSIIAFFGTLSLSYLSFRFYEAPFLRLKDRFTL